MKYWIIVASKDHIQRGLAGGFIQANHGKAAPLRRMHAGDWVIFYSPKLEYGKPEKCQCFTAIVRVVDEEVYQYQQGMGGGFLRKVQFLPSKEISILAWINELTFIKDRTHWGAPFRFGILEIPEQDFQLIASQMIEDPGLFKR